MSDERTAEAEGPAIETMRDAVADRIRSTSLRSVAREIGMSAAGLKKFLDGAAPYTPTVRRLRIWYVQHAAGRGGEVLAAEAAAALNLLLFDLAPEPRRTAAAVVLDAMAAGYADSGKDVPPWLDDLRARYLRDDEAAESPG